MNKLGRLLLLALLVPLNGCYYELKIPDGVIYVHTYIVEDGKRIMDSQEVGVELGEDLSGKLAVIYHDNDWKNVGYPTGIYLDRDEKLPLKTSQLTHYDNSFKEVYIKCVLLKELNIEQYLEGEYHNYYGEKLTISENKMNGVILNTLSFNNTVEATSNSFAERDLTIYKGEEQIIDTSYYSRSHILNVSNGKFVGDEIIMSVNHLLIETTHLSTYVYDAFDEIGLIGEDERKDEYVKRCSFYKYQPLTILD